MCTALKGHNKWYRLFSINSHTHCYALSGHYILALSTVGVAHGYYILPFQGVITWHCLPMALPSATIIPFHGIITWYCLPIALPSLGNARDNALKGHHIVSRGHRPIRIKLILPCP